MKFRTCEKCGENLDFGEHCSCEEEPVIHMRDYGELHDKTQYELYREEQDLHGN